MERLDGRDVGEEARRTGAAALVVERVGFEGPARRRPRLERSPSPRRASVVDRRLGLGASDVLRTFDGPVEVTAGATRLVSDAGRRDYDPVEHEHRLPARMHLAWSRPSLPVWLAVAELSSSTCALRISLRSGHRLRYPWRYFAGAHVVLDELRRRVEQ